jgi:hypothetical protein
MAKIKKTTAMVCLTVALLSLFLAGCTTETVPTTPSTTTPSPTTSLSGEQVDVATFERNFTDIRLHRLPKEGEEAVTLEQLTTTTFDASELGIGWHISTTPNMDPSIEVTIKLVIKKTGETGMEFSPSTPLKPSSGHGEAFPMPPAGQYQINFYADNVLVKVIDFEVR